jgi:hypothetical protein
VGVAVEHAAGLGELRPLRRTEEQDSVELTLERADRPGQRGLGHAQAVGGCGEGALVGDGENARPGPS